MSCSVDDGDLAGLEPGFHADHRQHGLVARVACTVRQVLTLVRLDSL